MSRIIDYPAPDRVLDGTEVLPIWEGGQQRGIPIQLLWSLAAAQNPAFKASSSGWLLTPATRLALAAVVSPAPINRQAAYLCEAGYVGVFVFSSANLSTQVTADLLVDTGGRNYVAPNSDRTGASGAWVRTFDSELSSSRGAGYISYTFGGIGAVTRTVQDKLRDIVDSKDFGLAGDGTDEGTKLAAFFNSAVANRGIKHRLQYGTFLTSILLPQISTTNVWIEGAGSEVHDAVGILSGSVIKYIGAAAPSSSLIDIEPVSLAGAQHHSNVIFKGIGLDGNSGLIGTLLTAKSIQECDIDVAVANASATAVYLGVVATLGEARDLQRNRIRINGRQIEAPGGHVLTLDGDSAANVSMNQIEVDAEVKSATAIVCINSDNNDWRHIRVNSSGSATYAMELQGGATSTQMARSETIYFYSSNLPIHVGGTDAYTVASNGHRIVRLDNANSTPGPVLGTGASIGCEAWQTYTPTITGTAGSGLASTGASGAFFRNYGFVDVEIQFQVTAGTGYAAFTATLPYAVQGTLGADGSAKEIVSNSKAFSAFAAAGGSSVSIQSLDGATALPTGTYTITLRYRAA